MTERQRCQHCDKELHENRMEWLELSFKTGRWYKPGSCPEDESQGCFPFGRACAKTVLADQATSDRVRDAVYSAGTIVL